MCLSNKRVASAHNLDMKVNLDVSKARKDDATPSLPAADLERALSVVDAREELLEQHQQDVVAIYEAALLHDRLSPRARNDTLRRLRAHIRDPDTIVKFVSISASNETNRLLGFGFATPDSDNDDTMKIEVVALHPDAQGRKLIVPLMSAIETEMKNRGFTHGSIDASTQNGFADKFERAKGRAIVDYQELGNSHRHFRYSLS